MNTPHLEPRGQRRASSALDTRPLGELAPTRAYWKGSDIGAQGQPCESIYIIVRGQVLLSRRGQDGVMQPLYVLGAGDLFGEGSLRPDHRWLVSARTLTDVVAHVLSATQFPQLAQYYPQLTTQILSLLAARLERAHRRLDLVTTDSARARVFGLLSVMAEYHGEEQGGQVWVPMRLTQAEFGQMLGLARETVARLMAALESEGLIRRQGRRGFWFCASLADPAAALDSPTK